MNTKILTVKQAHALKTIHKNIPPIQSSRIRLFFKSLLRNTSDSSKTRKNYILIGKRKSICSNLRAEQVTKPRAASTKLYEKQILKHTQRCEFLHEIPFRLTSKTPYISLNKTNQNKTCQQFHFQRHYPANAPFLYSDV